MRCSLPCTLQSLVPGGEMNSGRFGIAIDNGVVRTHRIIEVGYNAEICFAIPGLFVVAILLTLPM